MKVSVRQLLYFLFLLAISVKATAQQDPMYSQYMFNGLVLNPAYAGSQGGLSGTALYRNQWTGMDGAPVTQSLSIHAPLNKDKIGLGLSVVNDKIGIANTMNLLGAYSYMIQTSAGKLALGLQAGIIQYRADYSKIQFIDQVNESVNSKSINLTKFAIGAGIYYYSDKFYIGFSAPRIGAFKTRKDTVHDPHFAGHYFVSTGMVIDLSASLKLKPSMLFKAVQGAPPQADINATLYFKELLGFGISYRSFESIAAMLQLNIAKKFRIGYSYDYGATGGLQKYNSGSHELMLQVNLVLKKDKIISPRYF
jgi:type IX secretion system PorP/SprF family membrane protein